MDRLFITELESFLRDAKSVRLHVRISSPRVANVNTENFLLTLVESLASAFDMWDQNVKCGNAGM
jgi:hypothetical protein